jgi:hypothetical protein
MTRRGLLYDKNYTKRKKDKPEDLSGASESDDELIVQSQSQRGVGRMSDSFDDELFDDEFMDGDDEADEINVKQIRKIEAILDMRLVVSQPIVRIYEN